jgi:mannose/cellobiose epimerase-like protein (N-acyl-D-glucosamine 2-epimerase family)
MVKIPKAVEEWRSWLRDAVLPYWEASVAAEPVGYVEYLTPNGQPDKRSEKTPLVTGRLIYAFSHAHILGLSQKARAAAEHGFRFLTERCWDAHEGGFFHAVTADGTPVDRRKDAYDHAFALFAMAWLHRATASREPLDWAKRTIDYMDSLLADRANGGYREYLLAGEPQPLPRRQNPHMHLLEAFHALYEATHDGVWQVHASAMVDLFFHHLFDRETGTLAEFFTGDWGPAPGAAGVVREPGHHFEWVWLLHRHVRLMGESRVLGPAEQLYRFAVTHGIDRDPRFVPAAFDEVDRMGRVVTDSKLLWPQTEAIKAFLARWEFLGDPDAAQRARGHLAMLFRWFLIDRTGRWRNRLARDGQDLSPDLPVRVFYHLFLCLAETLRLWATLPESAASGRAEISE